MKEIEDKLIELFNLLTTIPDECKGEDGAEARRRYLKVKRAIHDLIEEC